MSNVANRKWESATETAKIVRAILKAQFRGIKFTVQTKSYSGGASIRIGWTDGPLTEQVKKVVSIYEGARFDSMQDLKSHHDRVEVLPDRSLQRIQSGADYIFCDRERSPERVAMLEAECAAYYAEWQGTKTVIPGCGPMYWHWMNEMETQLYIDGKLPDRKPDPSTAETVRLDPPEVRS